MRQAEYAIPCALIVCTGPEPGGLGSAGAGRQHPHGRIVGGDEALAAGAGQPGTDDAVYDGATRNILQLFRDVLADPAQAAAAIGTGSGAGISSTSIRGTWFAMGRRLGFGAPDEASLDG